MTRFEHSLNTRSTRSLVTHSLCTDIVTQSADYDHANGDNRHREEREGRTDDVYCDNRPYPTLNLTLSLTGGVFIVIGKL